MEEEGEAATAGEGTAEEEGAAGADEAEAAVAGVEVAAAVEENEDAAAEDAAAADEDAAEASIAAVEPRGCCWDCMIVCAKQTNTHARESTVLVSCRPAPRARVEGSVHATRRSNGPTMQDSQLEASEHGEQRLETRPADSRWDGDTPASSIRRGPLPQAHLWIRQPSEGREAVNTPTVGPQVILKQRKQQPASRVLAIAAEAAAAVAVATSAAAVEIVAPRPPVAQLR